MKFLVITISLFLSAAVLSADIKDLTRGSDLDQAYRKKWESVNNNGEGGPEVIQYQNADSTIYDQYGNRYVLEGTFTYENRYGKKIEKNCAGTMLSNYPSFDWALNWEKYLSGLIAGSECKIVREIIEEIEVKKDISPENTVTEPLTLEQRIGCQQFAGYAPPLVWSVPVATVSHIGPTAYTISVKVLGDTAVMNWAKHWDQHADKWNDVKWVGSFPMTIYAGHAVASVWMTYRGLVLGSAVETTIC